MEKTVVLITGTSTGLGLKTAILFAKKGHRVYATMRNIEKKSALEKEAQAADVQVCIEQLDVLDEQSISTCVRKIIEKEGQIDVLINNAGAGFLRASEQATDQEIQQVMDVNYFSVVRCTNAVLPFMRERKKGHIINVSSVGGLVGQPFNELYCAAKFAVEGYTEALASYITPFFHIHFTIVEPGGISTEFANSVLKDFTNGDKPKSEIYTPILQQYMIRMQSRPEEDRARIYQTGKQVAEVIHQCVVSENPPLRIRTSDWANEFCQLKTVGDPDGLKLLNALRKSYFN